MGDQPRAEGDDVTETPHYATGGVIRRGESPLVGEYTPPLVLPRAGVIEAEVFVQRRYRCPSCRKSWASRTRADHHIADGCHRDLAVRACSTCKHDHRGEYEYGDGPGCDLGVRPEHEHIIRYCEKWEAQPWLLTA